MYSRTSPSKVGKIDKDLILLCMPNLIKLQLRFRSIPHLKLLNSAFVRYRLENFSRFILSNFLSLVLESQNGHVKEELTVTSMHD